MSALAIIFFLLLLNGFFSMCEIALVSSRRSRLTQKAKKGRKGAVIALQLLEEPEKFLSTVQIGITLVGIIAGAYGGEQFTPYVTPFIERSEWLRPAAEQIAFALVVTGITYVTIIIGELVPKTLAFNNPEKITMALAPAMRTLTVIAFPLVWILSLSTRLVLRLLFIRPTKSPPITEDELKYLIDSGARHGTIAREEGEILHSVFRFGDQTANTLMTSRDAIGWLNATQPKEALLSDVFKLPFTKYPVCQGSVENIIGVISVTDILRHINSPGFDIRNFISQAVFFAENTPALRILETFRRKKVHIGFVKDSKGNLTGLVTLHDLVENIIGSLPESDAGSAVMIRREDGSLLVSGGTRLESVLNSFALKAGKGEKELTVSALVQMSLSGAVRAGRVFNACGLRFEIMDVDGTRIDKVLVSRIAGA